VDNFLTKVRRHPSIETSSKRTKKKLVHNQDTTDEEETFRSDTALSTARIERNSSPFYRNRNKSEDNATKFKRPVNKPSFKKKEIEFTETNNVHVQDIPDRKVMLKTANFVQNYVRPQMAEMSTQCDITSNTTSKKSLIIKHKEKPIEEVGEDQSKALLSVEQSKALLGVEQFKASLKSFGVNRASVIQEEINDAKKVDAKKVEENAITEALFAQKQIEKKKGDGIHTVDSESNLIKGNKPVKINPEKLKSWLETVDEETEEKHKASIDE